MVLLADKPELNLPSGRCVSECCAASCKTCDFGSDSRLFIGPVAGACVARLPVQGITKKRMKQIVQTGVFHIYPAFCTVTASGSDRRPAAGSFFCFGSRRLRLRFPSTTDPP